MLAGAEPAANAAVSSAVDQRAAGSGIAPCARGWTPFRRDGRRAIPQRVASAWRRRPILLERERDASHTDFRDAALAVLTAEQQARAWEMMSARRAMLFARANGRIGPRGGPAPRSREER